MTGILQRPYALTTVGIWSLVFLAAFEALAVTTIMPVVTADLDGRALYSLAFSATLAASVVAMVLSGAWADARGPGAPLITAIALFALGLAVAGLATSMPAFIAGRFLQGLGAGGINVTLYVLAAKVYPTELHIKVFAASASAWVLPSIVGPFLAGVIADALSWHWVFLGVLALVAVATAMVLPALRRVTVTAAPGSFLDGGRLTRAAGLALLVVALSYSADLDRTVAWVVAPVALVVIALVVRGLIPPGTARARPGLPAAVLISGAAGAVFFATEVYLPLLLQDRYGMAVWLSGMTLTAAAVSWSLASAVRGRLGDRLRPVTAMRTGAALLFVGALTELLCAALHLPAPLVAVGWLFAGAGMGTIYPQVSALVLAYSSPGREGGNSSARSITDAVAASTSLALTGLIFGTVTRTPFVGVLVLTTAIALVVVLLAGRAGAGAPAQASETATISS